VIPMTTYAPEIVSPDEFMRRVPALPGSNTPWGAWYGRDLRGVIERQAHRSPRNLQVHLGPSELGEVCDRQIVGKMAGEPITQHVTSPWPSIIGTAVHAWLAAAFDNENRIDGIKRWITENKVAPVPAHPGTADLYDASYFAVVDWKGVSVHTPIATPGGWTTMGRLQPGDTVFGADGSPCTVTRTYPVQYRDCYRITFDDGSELITDDVQELPYTVSGKRSWPVMVMGTAEARRHVWSRSTRPQRQLRLYNGAALDLPEQDLVVHPYVLGCWLGDGGVHSGTIGSAGQDAEEIFGYIRNCGYKVSAPYGQRKFVRNVYGLSGQLRVLGLQWRDLAYPQSHGRLAGIKRIPAEYLRGSYEQRLSLLQGLMDTDGTWNRPRKRAVFNTTDKGLASAVAELVTTLGWKAHIAPHQSTGFGLTVTEYYVEFTPHDANPFRLSRKADLVRIGSRVSGYRIVQAIEPILSVPTRCIDVDSPDHLYLAGEQMIPVHNCLGPTTIAKIASPSGPPRRYLVQLLLYAMGYQNAGYRVDRVVLAALPRTSPTLASMYIWEHQLVPEDQILISQVLAETEFRARLAQGVLARQISIEEVPITPTSDNCQWCPFYRPQAAHENVPGCPGRIGYS
jgi:hypothetical protein